MAQVRARTTVPMGPEAFAASADTALWWLTNAGFLINAHGTLVMIDPAIVLQGPGVHETGHRMLVELPLRATEVPRLDLVLYTHADYDHFAPATARELVRTGAQFAGPPPVAEGLRELGLPAERMQMARARESFTVGAVTVTVTPADHPWQARDPARFGPPFGPGDCCGYLVATPEGGISHPGDTRLMEEHLRLRGVDVLLLDVSRNAYHLGVGNAARLADALASPTVIPHHYGTYDEPEASPDNPYDGDPAEVAARMGDPGRMQFLAPGERLRVSCVP